MGSGFHVTTEELRSHAGSIDGVADDVGTAEEAAGEKRMGGDIYGVLFDKIIQLTLNQWADRLHESLGNETELGHTIAKGIRANADIYDGVEDRNNTTVKKSGEN